MKRGPALIERKKRKGRTLGNRVYVPLLPVPVFAMPSWNRVVRDWIQS
jgi:hypothetical protein